MLKPDYFYGKSDRVVQYYQDLEDYLLNDIAKFLLKAGTIGGKADRELFVLEQMGLSQAQITKRLSELTNKSRNAVRSVLQDSVMTSFSNDKEVLDKYFNGEFGPLNNPVIVDVMDAEWRKTNGELYNLTRSTMNQYNMDVVNLLDQAEIRVASGNQSYTSAVCEVLDEYAKAGMVINYPTGARKTLEAAVRCCVVTSMNQTAAQVTNKYIAEGGIEYVLVSAHTGARYSDKGGPYSHEGWQGKAFKIVGSEPGYPNLLESTGYTIDPVTGNGTVVNPHGLHGYNCRHSHQPWEKDMENPWIKPDGTPRIDPEESRKKYELQQQQRAMERSIRSSKRQLNMKQSEIDVLPDGPEKEKLKLDYDRLAYKLRERNKAYDEFCASNKLPKQADRVKVAGFTKEDMNKVNGRASIIEHDKNVESIAKANGDAIIKIDGRSVNKREFMNLDYSQMAKYKNKVPNKYVRQWYIEKDKNIENLIDKSQSLEHQAREAHYLRNKYRTQARNLMLDQEQRRKLDKKHPNIKFEELVKHKIQDKGLIGDKVYIDIIQSAKKTNNNVNKKYGLEG